LSGAIKGAYPFFMPKISGQLPFTNRKYTAILRNTSTKQNNFVYL